MPTVERKSISLVIWELFASSTATVILLSAVGCLVLLATAIPQLAELRGIYSTESIHLIRFLGFDDVQHSFTLGFVVTSLALNLIARGIEQWLMFPSIFQAGSAELRHFDCSESELQTRLTAKGFKWQRKEAGLVGNKALGRMGWPVFLFAVSCCLACFFWVRHTSVVGRLGVLGGSSGEQQYSRRVNSHWVSATPPFDIVCVRADATSMAHRCTATFAGKSVVIPLDATTVVAGFKIRFSQIERLPSRARFLISATLKPGVQTPSREVVLDKTFTMAGRKFVVFAANFQPRVGTGPSIEIAELKAGKPVTGSRRIVFVERPASGSNPSVYPQFRYHQRVKLRFVLRSSSLSLLIMLSVLLLLMALLLLYFRGATLLIECDGGRTVLRIIGSVGDDLSEDR